LRRPFQQKCDTLWFVAGFKHDILWRDLMSQSRKLRRRGTTTRNVVPAAIAVAILIARNGDSVRSARPSEDAAGSTSVELGHSIFHREWLAHDPRSQAGDGLGPLFNESSCIACHNMGGAGGAGPVEKNVELLTATAVLPLGPTVAITGDNGQTTLPAAGPQDFLTAIHTGFKDGDTIVLHRFGTDRDAHDAWRTQARSGAVLAQQVFESSGNVDVFVGGGPPPDQPQFGEADQGQFPDVRARAEITFTNSSWPVCGNLR
jgi:hypothetical protein